MKLNLFSNIKMVYSKNEFRIGSDFSKRYPCVTRTKPIIEDEENRKGVYKNANYRADFLSYHDKEGQGSFILGADGKFETLKSIVLKDK